MVRQVCSILSDQKLVAGWLGDFGESSDISAGLEWAKTAADELPSMIPVEQGKRLGLIIHRIIVAPSKISFEFDIAALANLLAVKKGGAFDDTEMPNAPTRTVELAIRLHRRGMGTRVIVDGPSGREADADLVNMVAKANYFLTRLTDGSCTSIKELASGLKMHRADIDRILPLAFLSPSIVEKILAGSQPADLTSAQLARAIGIPASWSAQQTAVLLQRNLQRRPQGARELFNPDRLGSSV